MGGEAVAVPRNACSGGTSGEVQADLTVHRHTHRQAISGTNACGAGAAGHGRCRPGARRGTRMQLLALSDVHVEHEVNRKALAALPAHPGDWLVLAGDVSD